jgi:hypothetical protein
LEKRFRRRDTILRAVQVSQRLSVTGYFHDGVIVRIKFEATDATGKVHKRSRMSHVYSHCAVIHFAAHPPSKLWPKGVAACSHAEWVGAVRWPSAKPAAGARKPCVEAIEILEARQV